MATVEQLFCQHACGHAARRRQPDAHQATAARGCLAVARPRARPVARARAVGRRPAAAGHHRAARIAIAIGAAMRRRVDQRPHKAATPPSPSAQTSSAHCWRARRCALPDDRWRHRAGRRLHGLGLAADCSRSSNCSSDLNLAASVKPIAGSSWRERATSRAPVETLVVGQDFGVDVVGAGNAGLGRDDVLHHHLGLRIVAALDFGLDGIDGGSATAAMVQAASATVAIKRLMLMLMDSSSSVGRIWRHVCQLQGRRGACRRVAVRRLMSSGRWAPLRRSTPATRAGATRPSRTGGSSVGDGHGQQLGVGAWRRRSRVTLPRRSQAARRALRTEFGQPAASMRLRTATPIAASVLWPRQSRS